jgi:GxxExxY protein
VAYRVAYCGQDLPVYFRADMVCFDAVIVEVKATRGLAPIDEAQAINYLKVSRLQNLCKSDRMKRAAPPSSGRIMR